MKVQCDRCGMTMRRREVTIEAHDRDGTNIFCSFSCRKLYGLEADGLDLVENITLFKLPMNVKCKCSVCGAWHTKEEQLLMGGFDEFCSPHCYNVGRHKRAKESRRVPK